MAVSAGPAGYADSAVLQLSAHGQPDHGLSGLRSLEGAIEQPLRGPEAFSKAVQR